MAEGTAFHNFSLRAISIVTIVNCCREGAVEATCRPAGGVVPTPIFPVLVTNLEEMRLNCRPISPRAQVPFIMPQAFFDIAKSNQAPTYHPFWLLFRPVPRGFLASVNNALDRSLSNRMNPP